MFNFESKFESYHYANKEIERILDDEGNEANFSKFLTTAFLPVLLKSFKDNKIKALFKKVILLRVTKCESVHVDPDKEGSTSSKSEPLSAEEDTNGKNENQKIIFYFATEQQRDQVFTVIKNNNNKQAPACLSAVKCSHQGQNSERVYLLEVGDNKLLEIFERLTVDVRQLSSGLIIDDELRPQNYDFTYVSRTLSLFDKIDGSEQLFTGEESEDESELDSLLSELDSSLKVEAQHELDSPLKVETQRELDSLLSKLDYSQKAEAEYELDSLLKGDFELDNLMMGRMTFSTDNQYTFKLLRGLKHTRGCNVALLQDSKDITLRNGKKTTAARVAEVMPNLQKLYDTRKAAFLDFIQKCKNPNHKLSTQNIKLLENLGLVTIKETTPNRQIATAQDVVDIALASMHESNLAELYREQQFVLDKLRVIKGKKTSHLTFKNAQRLKKWGVVLPQGITVAEPTIAELIKAKTKKSRNASIVEIQESDLILFSPSDIKIIIDLYCTSEVWFGNCTCFFHNEFHKDDYHTMEKVSEGFYRYTLSLNKLFAFTDWPDELRYFLEEILFDIDLINKYNLLKKTKKKGRSHLRVVTRIINILSWKKSRYKPAVTKIMDSLSLIYSMMFPTLSTSIDLQSTSEKPNTYILRNSESVSYSHFELIMFSLRPLLEEKHINLNVFFTILINKALIKLYGITHESTHKKALAEHQVINKLFRFADEEVEESFFNIILSMVLNATIDSIRLVFPVYSSPISSHLFLDSSQPLIDNLSDRIRADRRKQNTPDSHTKQQTDRSAYHAATEQKSNQGAKPVTNFFHQKKPQQNVRSLDEIENLKAMLENSDFFKTITWASRLNYFSCYLKPEKKSEFEEQFKGKLQDDSGRVLSFEDDFDYEMLDWIGIAYNQHNITQLKVYLKPNNHLNQIRRQ
jgi:hypothetical protein